MESLANVIESQREAELPAIREQPAPWNDVSPENDGHS